MVPSLETHASWFSKNWLLGGPWGIGFIGGNSLVMVAKGVRAVGFTDWSGLG